MTEPFILLDDARPAGPSAARLYRAPSEIVVARRAAEVGPALLRLEQLRGEGYDLAGYMAYEAGLALEERLVPLADARSGAMGPLIWFGAFKTYESIAADQVPDWLARHAQPGIAQIGPIEPQISLGGYAAAFQALQQAIAAGDIYQANLTFHLAGSYRGDPLALYAAMRPAAQAGYGGIVFDGSHWLLSCSPELFFADRDGAVIAKPMKGTRPRGRDAAEDQALAAQLSASTKDRAENLMIVDLLRNDLSRVAEAGTVKVENPFAVESYPTVHTMTTTIRARLMQGKGPADLIRALFPCGSITGAPKIRAMELINEVERDARGPYCGAIGRIDADGEAAFNVAIRTLRLTPEENGRGRAVLGVGGAIVADSEALPEWREALIKGGFVRLHAAGADLIETMAFDPERGIPLLEFHLERIKSSAGELGFAFDRHAVRNQIQALCFDLDQPAKVRLLLSRNGATALDVAPLSDGLLSQPVVCAVLPLPVDTGDWRLRHKTTDRAFYDQARLAAQAAGAAEAILIRDDGLITEASRSNVFVPQGDLMITPPLALGLLPGVLRRTLIAEGRAKEGDVRLEDLADGFFLGNSVRGLMQAQLL